MHGHLRILVCAMTLALAVGDARAQEQQGKLASSGCTFAGLSWGADSSAVRTRLEREGYVYQRTDGEGDLVFHGSSVGYPAIVYAMMSRGQLVKTDVILLPPANRVRAVYSAMKETLAGKYGEGESIEFFRDGDDAQALRADKARLLSHWSRGSDELLMHVASVSDSLVVSIAYESANWEAESKARRAKATKLY